MPKNKIIFLSVGLSVLLLLIFGIYWLSTYSKSKSNYGGPKEFNIWVVRDESAGYSDIITGFKAKYPEFNKTSIKVTKFSSYADYEKILINVMGDGNSPDIFVVNNNGGTLLEQKVVALPDDIINVDNFSKKFNKVFDELIIENTEKDKEGTEKTVSYLKGIPTGYETLGVFYNWKLVKNIPATWSDLDEEIKNNGQKENYATIGLGLGGKYVFSANDIFTLMLLQNKISNYRNLNQVTSINSLGAYFSYVNDINNNILSLKSEMDQLNLTTVDLFVRGKIGMLIGYPSLLREIELAVKRTAGNSALDKKTLKSSELFQITSGSGNSSDKNPNVNLVNYNYFAISKLSKNQKMGYKFLSYLSTKDAQKKYMKSFAFYLPALKELEEERLDENMDSNYERVKYKSFLTDGVELQSFDKGLKNEYDYYFYNHLNDFDTQEKKNILNNAIKFIDCNKNHLINNSSFEEECK
ncbi:carbohydrate ABC transporter substrate-binding protein [Candidatus Gracilibacteria bacterium]|nr:carbohydrate ABC transporter substrate-binding protein [Candidatus Gracilibacteria bacterium]